jgi:hypothetical protein
MKTRLNLTIDEGLHMRIKNYAASNNVSVSELVENFFKNITKPAKKKNIIDLVEKLDKPAISGDADLKELYYREQSRKYGF